MKQTFRILARNVYINDLATNVHTHNLGLGAQIGRASLHFYTSANSGAAALRMDDNGPYELTTIDSLNLAECGFIKIDVEGFHKEVLYGARDTINQHKPLVWIELRNYGVHKEYDEGDAFMRSVGYKQIMAITAADFLYGPS
jgi:FkbM family methyltransferase